MNALLAGFWVILAIPIFFSGVVYALRHSFSKTAVAPQLDEKTEQSFLAAMLLPSMTGVLFVTLSPYVPSSLPPLLLDEIVQAIDTAGVPFNGITATVDTSLFEYFSMAFVAFYGLGLVLGLVRFARGKLSLQSIVSGAVHAPDIDAQAFVTDEPVSPFATLSKKIVLPELLVKKLPKKQLALVLAHEKAHLVRHDPIYFLGLAIIDAVFWPNIFLKLQTRKCRLTAEQSCDIAAIGANSTERRVYADALLASIKSINPATALSAPTIISTHCNSDYALRLANIMVVQDTASRQNRHFTYSLLVIATVVLSIMQWAYTNDSIAAPDFLVRPVEGRLSSPYGMRFDPFNKQQKMHNGTDIEAVLGTPIFAPAAGVIIRSENISLYGNIIEIRHTGGYVTRYTHLANFAAARGDKVSAGEIIGTVGSSGRTTGPHVHVEVFRSGKRVDPATILNLPTGQKRPDKTY
ncbi:MAG: M23/M56 family metallopeptidase [Pseudomonadota bacterium]